MTPEQQRFFDYVLKFYGKDGIYADDCNWPDEQLKEACIERSQHPDWCDGDTIDREAVRDKLLGLID